MELGRMGLVLRRRSWPALVALTLGCSVQDPAPLRPAAVLEPIPRTGIDGSNCAGAAPAMTAPDGHAYVFQSVVAYYYNQLQAFWTMVDGDAVLTTWLPAAIEQTSEAFYAWQAKSVQIFRDRGRLGFAHRYYPGVFGFLETTGDVGTCKPALDPAARLIGMLAHIGLSQAGECGRNDDGTIKFWQVNNIALLRIGDVIDAGELVSGGMAQTVTRAPASRCILPADGMVAAAPIAGSPGSVPELDPVIPCRVAFRGDAITEAVVLPVPSLAKVAGVPLEHRAFTAAGTVEMPNDLDEVRTILRSTELRAMFAIGVPRFLPEPTAGPSKVRLVGHAIGPASEPSAALLLDERSWVDRAVGGYAERCCHVECGPVAAAPTPTSSSFALSGCTTVCIPEGVCRTGSAQAGLVVMVSSLTTTECFGSCPEPASSPPDGEPTCAP